MPIVVPALVGLDHVKSGRGIHLATSCAARWAVPAIDIPLDFGLDKTVHGNTDSQSWFVWRALEIYTYRWRRQLQIKWPWAAMGMVALDVSMSLGNLYSRDPWHSSTDTKSTPYAAVCPASLTTQGGFLIPESHANHKRNTKLGMWL